MKPVILITRPEAEAADTIRQVTAMGFNPISAPVLTIENIPVTLPLPGTCDGLIFSSANAIRAFEALKPDPLFFGKPAFTVGDHTAALATAAGFKDVRSASGTMRDLAALIRRQMVSPARLLHLRGREIRDNPALLLPQSEGWSIDGITVYGADPVDEPSAEATHAIETGHVTAILFYSARSAAAFITLYGHLDFKGVKALCLADSVLNSLDRRKWGEVIISARPDQSGMMALLQGMRQEKPMQIYPTANNDDADALNDAEIVIERFGGIRPMATKMNIPVTTVQGWKKRNVIPGNRRNDVMDAAKAYHVDLSDILAPHSFSNTLNAARRAGASNPAIDMIHHSAINAGVTHEDMMTEIKKSQLGTIRKSVTASAGLLMVLAMFGGLFIAIGKHRIDRDDTRITALEEQAPAAFTDGQPTPFAKMMDSLKARIDSIETTVTGLKDQAGSLAGGSVTDRLSALEGLMGKLSASPSVGAAGTELQTLVQSMQGRMDKMDDALAEQQKSNTALGQALDGVSPKELKAAAMLIGLTQFRESVGRNAPFADDLAMMQRLSGDQDPELNAAIEKLSPYAEKGVLSPSGLSRELTGLTGDILVSSVSGEDASIQDKAMARFQKYITIEKDGKQVMGSDAQARVARAQALLNTGDVDGAMKELQSLQGPAKQAAQPVIDQGAITLMAGSVEKMLSQNIIGQLKNIGAKPVPLTAGGGASSFMGPLNTFNTQPLQQAP